MKMIICQPKILSTDKVSRLEAEVLYGEERINLFYEYERYLEPYITTERIDCFLVSLLPYAMIKAKKDGNVAIISKGTPISQDLYVQLTNFYLPILQKNISYYGEVKIECPVDRGVLPSEGACGTGVSGGIDSSYTIAKYAFGDEKSIKLTHGVFYNLGIYGGFSSDTEKRLEKNSREIAEDVGIHPICIKTNTCVQLYKKAHGPIVPAVMMGGILSLQKLFSVYYMSADYSAEESYFSEKWAARYDWLNTFAFSTRNTKFYSAGLEATRMEKIKFIKDFPFTYRHISVCAMNEHNGNNCSKCAKCTETMAEFASIQALDKYKESFDVELYQKRPDYFLSYVLMKKWGREEACTDVIREYKKQHLKIPSSAYIGAVVKWIQRGFTADNPNFERVENII